MKIGYANPHAPTLSYTGEGSTGPSKGSIFIEDATLVPSNRFPLLIPIQDNVVISLTWEEFIMPSGVAQLVIWQYCRTGGL